MARKKKARRPYRSKFEAGLGFRLEESGIPFGYETETFKLLLPSKGHICLACRGTKTVQVTRYTPDFFLPRFIVEAKGRFTGRDRKKVLAMIEQYPGRTFALLFMRDNRLSKTSKTKYSDWCEANRVPYAIGTFKEAWLK